VAVATVDIQVNSQAAVSALRQTTAASRQLETAVSNTTTQVGNQNKQIQTAANGMRFFTDAAGRARAENGRFLSTAEKAAAGIENQTEEVNKLSTAVAALGVGIAANNALNIAKDFFATANAADAAQRRIKLVSQGLDDYRLVLQVAQNASSRFGLSQTEASRAIADIYTRLRPVGYNLSAINAIYEGFNTAVKLSGVEAGAASAAFLQLSQGLGSGTLQGDELRSVLEQMPSIAQAIAKEMDINVGSIKKFGSEGKITADVIVRALDRIRTEGAGKLAEALNTPQQKIIDLQNAMETFKIVVASDVAPAVIGGIEQITEAVKRATQFVINLREGFRLLAKAFSGIGAGINSINTALSGTINKFAALGQSKGLMMMLNFLTLGGAGALASLAGAGEKSLAGKKTPTPKVPTRVDLSGLDLGGGAAGKTGKTGGGAKSAETAAKQAAEEALRLKNALGDLAIERDLKQQIYGIDNRIFEANLVNDKQTVIRLEGQKRLAQISAEISKLEYEKLKPQERQSKMQSLQTDAVIAQRDTQQQLILNQVQVAKQAEAAIRPMIQENELLQAKINGTELEYQKRLLIEKLLQDNPALQRRDVEATVAKNEALQRQLTQAEQLKQIYSDVGMTIKSGVVDAIQGAIDGTKSLGEVATGILKSIANKVLDVAINFALFGTMSGTGTGGGLLGGLFKRANGGPVSPGTSYMVGERGPELFTPKHGGNIVPNNALGGGSTNVVVNVDASGSNVQGDQAQAKQLGVVVSAAVQAELVKQQRPGGLLAGTRR
jgi:tape measure domain-containing protein